MSAKMPAHRIEWRIEPELVDGEFFCEEPVDAPCRTWCAEGCEERCIGNDDGTEHEKRDQGRCLVVEWLSQDRAADYYSGPPLPVRDGPIKAEWESDYYTWHYLGTPT